MTATRPKSDPVSIDTVLNWFPEHKKNGVGWKVLCPAHADKNPSLRINVGKDGVTPVLKCHAGCDIANVLAAVGKTTSDLYVRTEKPRTPLTPPSRIVATYEYIKNGQPVFRKVRKEPKNFFLERYENGRWITGMKDVEPFIYNHDEVVRTNETVLLAEGEKDANTARDHGWVATTGPHGAGKGKWLDSYSDTLTDKDVCIVPHNDSEGYAYALEVVESLTGKARSVRVVRLTTVEPKGDLTDHFSQANGDPDSIRLLEHNLERVAYKDLDSALGLEAITLADLALLAGKPDKSSYVHMFAEGESSIDAPELSLFPVDVFPEAVRKYVSEGAESHNVPPDMIALPLLGFASGVIGNTIAAQVKPGWIERPILWTAIVGDPGSGKSHAIDYARAPLDVLQREAWEQYQQKLTGWEEAMAEAKGNKDRTDPLPEKPVLQHFFSTDATPEALASMLSTSPGVDVVREELVGWVKSHDAYRKAGDRQLHLSLWAGTPMKVDRKGAGSTYIPRPSVSIIGGIQPEMLSELAEEANRRDGFVERILMAWPHAKPMTWNEATIDATSAWEVEYIFRKLRVRVVGTDSDIVLKFSSEARRLFGNWYNDNGRIIAETSGIASGCYAKYPGQLARIALVLHCLHHPGNTTTDIASETVEDAIEVIEYLRQHLIRILPSFSASGSTKTASLEGRILRILGKAEGEWVARRELTRGLGNSVPSDDIRVVLEQLETAGKVENRIVPTGSRPREESRLLVAQKRTYEHMNKSPNGTASNGAYAYTCDGDKEEMRF